MFQRLSSYPAFTIIEVMLSGFLLTIGILSVVSLFAVAQRHARDIRSVMVASTLAQEGVEVARNIRDNRIAYRVANWTTCSSSTTGSCDPFYDFPNGASRDRTVSYNSTTFTTPGSTFLSYNGAGFQYHGVGTFTGFYRILRIDHTGSSDTARVQSFVTWQDISALPSSTTATSWCTPANKCVYTELLLSAWK